MIVSRLAAADDGDVTGITGRFPGSTILVPPLRLRGQDLLLLFQHYLEKAASRFATTPPTLSDAEMRLIMLHDWPGNLPELRSHAERFALGMGLAVGDRGVASIIGEPLPDRVAAFERSAIVQELRRNGGSVKATYMALGIPRKTLQDKMRKYQLKRGDFASHS